MDDHFEQQNILTDQPEYNKWAEVIDKLVLADEAQETNNWTQMFPDERPGMEFHATDDGEDFLTSLVDNLCKEEKEEHQEQQLLQMNNMTPMLSIDEMELQLPSFEQEAKDNYPQPDSKATCSKDSTDNVEAELPSSPLSTSVLAAELNTLIGKTPDVTVMNYENPFYLPQIMDSLRSNTSRNFNRMPHLLFVKGCDADGDDILSAVACNPKEARDLLKVHLENQTMAQLTDVEARARLEMVGRETKLAKPPRCSPRYSSVVLNPEAHENATLEPIQISTSVITNQQQQKKRRRGKSKDDTAAESYTSRTKVTIPANKKGICTYVIQMAAPIPVQIDETDSDDAVNLIRKETGEVVQARLCPYLMTVSFGSMNERVTIANPSEQLKTFVREECQLPCLLNETRDVCQIAFPTKNFGNSYSFKLGEWNEMMKEDHQAVTKRSSLLTTSPSKVTKTKANVGTNDQHDVLEEQSLAGGIARFVDACYPSLLARVPASMREQQAMTPNRTASIATNLQLPDRRTRTCQNKINTVEDTLSSMDFHSKNYVEALEKKALIYENVKDEYKTIVEAKEEIIKQNITLNENLQTVAANQNFVIWHLRRDINELKKLKETLTEQLDAVRQDAVSVREELERERDEFADQVVQRDKLIEALKREKEELRQENDALRKELRSVKNMCVQFEEKFNIINKKMESFEKRQQEQVDTFMTINSKRMLEGNEPSNEAKKMKFEVPRTVPVTVEA